jgi:hypothetical protein
MNKNNLLGNHSSAVNVSALKNSLRNKRVLVIDHAIPKIAYEKLRPFFDVAIAVGEQAGAYCGSPDILISTRQNPHVNGILDTSLYERYQSSILCITQSELNIIKNIAKYHSSYVLSWHPAVIDSSEAFGIEAAIPYCLNSFDPGFHLAKAAGATDIYALSAQGASLDGALDVLISEKRGYIPTNILRPIRPQFLDEARFNQ